MLLQCNVNMILIYPALAQSVTNQSCISHHFSHSQILAIFLLSFLFPFYKTFMASSIILNSTLRKTTLLIKWSNISSSFY